MQTLNSRGSCQQVLNPYWLKFWSRRECQKKRDSSSPCSRNSLRMELGVIPDNRNRKHTIFGHQEGLCSD